MEIEYFVLTYNSYEFDLIEHIMSGINEIKKSIRKLRKYIYPIYNYIIYYTHTLTNVYDRDGPFRD